MITGLLTGPSLLLQVPDAGSKDLTNLILLRAMSSLLGSKSSCKWRSFRPIGLPCRTSHLRPWNQANVKQNLQANSSHIDRVEGQPSGTRREDWSRALGMLNLDRGKQAAVGVLGLALSLALHAGIV